MDRGEILFAQNWVEQWKRNVRERGLHYRWDTDVPSLLNARIYGVDLFSWSENYTTWARRMNCLNPRWAVSSVEMLWRSAGTSVPQMIR